MTIATYDDVVCITSKYRCGIDQWWWRVKDTEDILYATFESANPNRQVREQAVLAAYSSTTKGVAVTRVGINEIAWVSPLESAFNAPAYIPTVRRDELKVLRKIQRGVDVIEYKGSKYIHKYMTPSSTRLSFEVEIQNYERTSDSPFVPKLYNVVTQHGENRGLLIEFISSPVLAEVQLTKSDKYLATKLILDALTDLEKRGYYPQDLKCCNLLIDSENQKLDIIDLGCGLTPGMYRPEAENDILMGKMKSKDMLYTLGRTVWELWDDEYEYSTEQRVPIEGSLPPVIENIVKECCSEELDPTLRVVDVQEKYRLCLEEIAKESVK